MKCYKTTTIILLLAVVAFAQNLCEKFAVGCWFQYRFCKTRFFNNFACQRTYPMEYCD